MSKEFKFSFQTTLPVLFGYLVLGSAAGLLVESAGYNFIWVFFISLIVYAGSLQFLIGSFLSQGLDLFSVAAMSLSINSRHAFYGLSFLEKFKQMGKARFYMIYTLTDETYSLLCSVNVPKELNENRVFFLISLLNHCYWIAGNVVGALMGQFLPIDTQGVEFAMTALFVVLFLEQIKTLHSYVPIYIGAVCGLTCLFFFKAQNFILPALMLTVALLLIFKPKITALAQAKIQKGEE